MQRGPGGRFFYAYLLLLCVVVSSGVAAPQKQYLSFAPVKVHLRGVMKERTFPGPPDFSDITKGDIPEHVWIMRLDHRVSVKAAAGDQVNDTVEDVREVTVFFRQQYYSRHWERLLGRHVEVTGELLSAINAHQRTPISIRAEAIVPRDHKKAY